MPVLAEASLDLLVTDPQGTYVDVTFGGGGHTRRLLGRLGPDARVFGFDQDPDAVANAESVQDERLTFVAANFRHLRRYLRLYGVDEVDGVLADLGVSSHQFDEPDRGFSYRYDAPLDMRMSQSDEQPSAAELLQRTDADALQAILGEYGEVRNARTLAHAIVERRETTELRTTGDLVSLLDQFVRGQRPRYLAQVFQALRIAVNEEMPALEDLLSDAQAVMKPGGRLVVISYHSGEDRLVKNVMKTGRKDGQHEKDEYGRITRPWNVVTKKPLEAPAAETLSNPRARSARLRAAMRNDEKAK